MFYLKFSANDNPKIIWKACNTIWYWSSRRIERESDKSCVKLWRIYTVEAKDVGEEQLKAELKMINELES
jgi:hypothetical protein